MNDTNLVSIGLPVFNGARYLDQAFNNLLSQSYTNIELIVSNNNSSDNTEDVCKRWMKKDARIVYFKQKKILSPLSNFNFVLSKAKGEMFMWASDDDTWQPNYITELVYQLKKKDADFIVPYWKVTNLMGTLQKDVSYPFLPSRWLTIDQYISTSFYGLKANAVYGLGTLRFIRSLGGFDKSCSLAACPDILLMHTMILKGKIFVSSKKTHFTKREVRLKEKYHESSRPLILQAIANAMLNIVENNAILVDVCREYYRKTRDLICKYDRMTFYREIIILYSAIMLFILYIPSDPKVIKTRNNVDFRNSSS